MKRLIALCLVLALTLFPAACSRSVLTKEDMMDTAVKLVNYELLEALEIERPAHRHSHHHCWLGRQSPL